MSQVSAQKQALRGDRERPLRVVAVGALRRLAKGIQVKKPSETAVPGLVDRP